MSDEDWGPWIEHDGKGCPLPDGTICHRVFDRPACGGYSDAVGMLEDVSPVELAWERDSWEWHAGSTHIIRYRIRRFRAEQTLREIAENIREPEAV